MTPNKNSVKAYKEIKSTLPDKEAEVLHLIKMYGPINGRMLDIRISGAHKRISALLERQAIEISHIGGDPVTGKDTAFYRITGFSPAPINVVKKGKGIDLGTFYDKAFRDGARAAVCMAIEVAGEPISIQQIEGTVDLICEVAK